MTKAKLLSFLVAGLVVAGHTACGGPRTKVKSKDPHAARPSAGSSEGGAAAATTPADLDAICRGAEQARAGEHDTTYAASSFGAHAFAGVFAAAERRYSIADLKALERKGQFEELLTHIEDVPPSSRGAEWDTLLEKAATGLLAQYDRDDASTDWGDFMIAESIVQRYPQLGKKDKFMAKRNKIGKIVVAKCFDVSYSGEECLGLARDFIRVDGTDPEVVLAVAKIVRLKQNSDVAVPFFLTALEVGKDTACGDDDLELATTAGLALPPDYDRAAGAREIAQNKCFAQLEGSIVEALKAPDASSYFKANACAVLRAKGVVK